MRVNGPGNAVMNDQIFYHNWQRMAFDMINYVS